MKFHRMFLVPGLIAMLLSHGNAYAAVSSAQARTPNSEEIQKQEENKSKSRGRASRYRSATAAISTREIYRRGYLAGYRAAAQRFRGDSRRVYVPADSNGASAFSVAARSETESSMSGSGYSAFRMLPSYAITPEYKITGQFGAKVSFGEAHDATAEDGLLILSRSGYKLSKVTNFSPRLEITLPISESSRATDTLITKFKLMPKLDFDFSPMGAKGLSAYTRLSLSKAFHSSTVTRSDSPSANTELVMAPEVGVGYEIAGPVSISLGGYRSFKWDYEGASSNGFLIYQELGLSVGKNLSVGLGHYTAGSLDDGAQLTLASQDASTFYGVFTYSL